MFTDIVGSTRLLRTVGLQTYERVLAHHHSILNEAWRNHNGHVVAIAGDGFLVAFQHATSALQAMTEAQRSLAAATWPDGLAVRVRMGVHCGLAAPVDGDYVALAVHQAARVCAVANGGSILLTRDVADRGDGLIGASLRSLGRFRVRDFDADIELLHVTAPDLDPQPPAVRARPASEHNLVRPASSFVGRDAECRTLVALLGPGRLVTVSGTGGIGKTRLAVETAFRTTASWPAGTWFTDVSLDAEPVRSLTAALGLPEYQATLDGLADHLGASTALLVLDNCESAPEICAHVATVLLSRCEHVGILATSREPLGVPGELLLRLGPLPLAGPLGSALDLFEERCHDARPSSTWSESERAEASTICGLLDGQPLALELAAAQSSRLSLGEIRRDLERGLRLLAIRRVGVPARQQSMASVIAWSYGRLARAAQDALGSLVLFEAPFTLDAALAAAGDEATTDDVFTLVDQSLLEAEVAANETRYRLFETVRQFVLGERGEADLAAAADRLIPWYLDRFAPDLATSDSILGELLADLGNVRAALVAADQRQSDAAQALAWTVGRALDSRHRLGEALEHLSACTERLSSPSPGRVGLLTLLADVHLRRGEVDLARRCVDEAARLRDAVGPPLWDDAGVERTRGELLVRVGDVAGVRRLVAEARERPLSPRGRARLANLVGIAALTEGDFGTAEAAFAEELATYEALGLLAPLASAHGNVAEAALGGGHPERAAHHQRRCLELATTLGQPVMVAFSAIVAARLIAERDATAAITLLAGAQVILDRTGVRLYEMDLAEIERVRHSAAQRAGQPAADTATQRGLALDDAGLAEHAAAALDLLEHVH